MTTHGKLRVGLNREMLAPDGGLPKSDMGLDLILSHPRVEFAPLARTEAELTPDTIGGYDSVISGTPRWTPRTFAGGEAGRILHVARFGVGWDSVDTAAATAAGVMVTVTRGALDYSVAESALSFILALAHRIPLKDRLVREGRWKERTWTLGWELREKTVGIVGLGAIGRKLAAMLAVFQPARILAFDPVLDAAAVRAAGAEKADLDRLLAESDHVSIHCPKTPETTNLLDARRIGLMKPTAFLVNTARGGIVDEAALAAALRSGRLRGAAIDVFESEPPPADNPLLTLDNVILSPHANSLTEESWRDIGRHACANIAKLADGGLPEHVVNPEVLDRPAFRAKLAALRQRLGV